MASTADFVRIHYHRPPDRHDLFTQRLVARDADSIVTFMERTPLARPVKIDDGTILEDGSPVIWFTFPGRWHDAGLFHTRDGVFTGTYANILTPVHLLDATTWETTDLFLDVWLDTGGKTRLLDEEELRTAVARRWVDRQRADRARVEADHLLERARTGDWPPAIVREWPLERVLRKLGAV